MSGPPAPITSVVDEKAGVMQHENVDGDADIEKSFDDPNYVIDPAVEKRLLWKMDLHIVPPLFVLFLMAFLDRVNIGNAKIQGLTEDLHMKGQQYNIALFIFFIPYVLLLLLITPKFFYNLPKISMRRAASDFEIRYILCEIPSNIILRKLKPSTWLCSIMFAWGVFTICQGLVKNFASLVALRFLIGIAEAGLVPGGVYVIAMYYKRHELQWRISMFFCASTLAGAFGGLLAYALAKMDGIGGYGGWRWIFIIEGLLTVVIAILFKPIVVDWPEQATWLTPEEKQLMLRRLAHDVGPAKMDHLDKRAIKRILSDWKVYVGIVMYLGIVNTGYASSFFIPTIINEMGYTAAESQVRSIPIWIVAAILAMSMAWLADKLKHRYAFTLLGLGISIIGYTLLLCQENLSVGVKYMACFFVVGGSNICQPITWVWLNNNVGGHYKRSVATAMQIGFGNAGGLIASNIFITAQAPRYPVGYGTSLALLVMCASMCTIFFFGLYRENKKRERGERDYRYSEEGADINNMGDDHPEFSVTMNVLEDQVTDLNYLATSPITVLGSIDMSVQQQQQQQQRQSSNASTASPADTGNAGTEAKRKAESEGNSANGAPHTRAKRTRYISIACNECKRRKIKCNGNTPCQRCGNLKLECQYAPNCCFGSFKESDEFKHMNAKLVSLQEQVDNLYANLNSLRAAGEDVTYQNLSERSMSLSQPPAPPISPLPRYRTGPRTPQFRGPTSSAFNLDVAKNTLNNMGYSGLADAPDDGMNTRDVTPQGSPPRMLPPIITHNKNNNSRDPIWLFNKEEMIRLCRAYEDEMGLMHPILNIERLILHGKHLFEFMDAALRSGLANPNAQNKGVNDRQTCILKMVLAIMCLLEGDGQSELGYQLYESVKKARDDALHAESVDIRTLPLITLVAIFHFFSDEEALAWRIVGQAARMCIELGLHRRDSLFKMFPDEEERADALRLFWAIYVLDRRWSFGTGLPFALQDFDIDPSLPEPVHNIPYLNAMIAYSRIGSKVWRSVGALSGQNASILNIEEINYLDYQVVQWQKSLPQNLQLPTMASPDTSSRPIHRLQILLYLRANQMRIHIYRPVLHSASSIQEHPSYANTVVELAKDSIRALTHLNHTTDIYTTQKVCFNYFLISALAVLFLASCHAPVQFSALCREEFYMALDLVKGFSNKSYVSKRLWKTIKGLKAVAPKLGLSQEGIPLNGGINGAPPSSGIGGVDPEDPHSSAALAMAGLAGHEISSLGGPGFGNTQQHANGVTNGSNNGKGNSPMNGFQMSHEMTSLFEAALGSVGLNGAAGGNGEYVGMGAEGDFSGIGSNVFGGDEELYRQLRDLF
ncbi:hypothetical protein B7463_g954, partial [Scytalidium lignicola]